MILILKIHGTSLSPIWNIFVNKSLLKDTFCPHKEEAFNK